MADTISATVKNLKNLEWHELAELFVNFPFSQKITSLMSAKAHLEKSINMDNPGQKTFLLANNPGVQYANLIRDIETLEGLAKSVEQTTETITEISFIPENPEIYVSDLPTPVSTESDTVDKKPAYTKKVFSKTKPATIVYQSNFTKWLLEKSSSKPKSDAHVQERKTEEFSIKIPDSNQLREEIVSEPLAALYAQQGLIKEAIEMYTKLSLKIPNKSTYFAEIIKKLKKSN